MTAELAFRCTPATFEPVDHARVRWLNERDDYELARAIWQARGISCTPDEWHDWHAQGHRYCGIVEYGSLVAIAAKWAYSPDASELAAVRTLETHRERGHATAVSSFITGHILAQGRLATVHMREDNRHMRRIASRLGFQTARDQ